MNKLIQGASLLLGSDEDIKSFSQKTSANILVISDSHGQRNVFKSIVASIPEACDALVFCGDGISDLVFCMEETFRDKKIAEKFPPVVAFVAGNGDSDRFPVHFNLEDGTAKKNGDYGKLKIPYEQTLNMVGHSIFITHGHKYGAYYGLEELSEKAKDIAADICLYGHTHVASDKYSDGVYTMNPGSITYPRSGLAPSCAVLSIGEKFISSSFYQFKITAAGAVFSPLGLERRGLFSWRC